MVTFAVVLTVVCILIVVVFMRAIFKMTGKMIDNNQIGDATFITLVSIIPCAGLVILPLKVWFSILG